jgi:hypothetical protein
LTSALNIGERLASRPCRFIPRSTHCVGGWVGPRACPDSVGKRKILHYRELNPPHIPSLYSLSYPTPCFGNIRNMFASYRACETSAFYSVIWTHHTFLVSDMFRLVKPSSGIRLSYIYLYSDISKRDTTATSRQNARKHFIYVKFHLNYLTF